MNIIAVIVVKSDKGIEEFYIDMALKSLIPYVSGIYIQNQGCSDNTIFVAKESVGDKVPLIIEEMENPFPRFSVEYNEPVYRNKSIERCEELFDSEWIIQCDADDIFTPHLLETVKRLDESGELRKYNGIFYASDRFITPEYKSSWRGDLIEYGGKMWTDPHYKFWRTNVHLRYPGRDPGQFHNVPQKDPNPVYCVGGICNIHLHRMFGPKAFNFWRYDGDVFEETKPFNPRRQAPKFFSSPQNMGSAVRVDYPWPDFIINRWKEWGSYE